MRSFLPFAALLGVALVLGCQDVGTGVVASEGLVPQFHHGKGHDDRGGGGGGGITNFVAAITNTDHDHPPFTAFPASSTVTTLGATTVLVDNKFNSGNSIAMNPVVVELSGGGYITLTLSAFSVRKRQGKLVSAKVWVGDGPNRFATDYLLAISPATILDGGFTLELHAAHADFVRLHDTSGIVAFTLNIDDIVYTPAS